MSMLAQTRHNLLANDSDAYFDCKVCWPDTKSLGLPWFRQQMEDEHERELKVCQAAAPALVDALERVEQLYAQGIPPTRRDMAMIEAALTAARGES